MKNLVKNRKIIIALGAVVCLIIIFYFYLSFPYPSWNSKDIERINGFLSNYRFKRELGYTFFSNTSLNITFPCTIKIFSKFNMQSSTLTEMSRINFSKFDHTLPLIEYVRVDLVARDSLEAYKNEFQQNHYACTPAVLKILSNSSLKSFQYKGMYVFCFFNFTGERWPYIGEKPKLYWCFATSMYKNVGVSYGEWGFAGSENLSEFLNSANATIEEFISSYS